MSNVFLLRKLLLPELYVDRSRMDRMGSRLELHVRKESPFEVCPRCATRTKSIYDHRVVRVKDAPLRGHVVMMHITKRRFSCKPCGRPFTEPVGGIRKGHRSTERYARELLKACEQYVDLSRVRDAFQCAPTSQYRMLYRHLDLQERMRRYPWPSVIGIDEHFFRRHPEHGGRQFVTMCVDHKNRRVKEVVEGKTVAELERALSHIEGRERVQYVTMDLSETYRAFVRSFFPNARIVADQFHVLRLLSPALNRRRKELVQDAHHRTVRRMLLTTRERLRPEERLALRHLLLAYPELRELYDVKEALHSFYRIKGRARAGRAFINLVDKLASSALPELQTLRKTLLRWQRAILEYFLCGLTNGRTEGFNLKAKLVKRRAYGYRSFRNYRLRLLNACA